MSEWLNHKHSEMPIVIEAQEISDGTVEFRLPDDIDGAYDFVLVVGSSEEVVDHIELVVGHQRLDGFLCHQAAVVSATIWGISAKTIGDTTFVPLPFAMTHSNQFLPTAAGLVNKVRARLMGDVRARLAIRSVTFPVPTQFTCETPCYQHQGPESYDVHPGVNEVALHLNHAVTHIAFWGLAEDTIKGVQLSLNHVTVLDTDVSSLQFDRLQRAPACQALVLFLSATTPPFRQAASAINMSRIDRARMTIDTTQAARLHVMAISVSVMKSANGIVGPKFAC